MIPAVQPTPVVCQGSRIAAIYLPAHCAPPRGLVAHRLQMVVRGDARPMVTLVPPYAVRQADTAAQAPCLLLALDSSLVGAHALPPQSQEICDPFVADIAHPMLCGFRLGIPPPADYLETLLEPLAEHLGVYYSNASRRREPQGLSEARLARAMEYIDQHLGEPISVEAIAAQAFLSPFHFTRMFHRSTGLTPHAYLTRRRMETARQLLADTDLPLREISRRVGYSTHAHFAYAFRRAHDVTPRAYRQRHRQRAKDKTTR